MSFSNTVYRVRLRSDKEISAADRKFTLKARVCVFSGPVAWYYLILPKAAGQTIRKRFGHMAKGWGSLPVEVATSQAVWQTSIFPDKKSGSYILPLKLQVRKLTGVKRGDALSFTLMIR